MKPKMRSLQTMLIMAVALALVLPHRAAAAPDYQRHYKTGMTSVDTGDWEQVEKMMRRAIEERSEEKRRIRFFRLRGYYPHYYLGLAHFHQGDCAGALAAWSTSESQGAIVGRAEYAEMSRLQTDCQKDGTPSVANRSQASESSAVGGRKTTKEKVRTGQHVVEKSADPARKTFGAIGRVAPEDSDLGKLARDGENTVDLLESATNLVDVAMPPPKNLAAAIDAYFSGSPERTLDLLRSTDMSDPRARAQTYLFRAAASYRLHVLSDDGDALLAQARRFGDLFQQEQWRKDFPAELFDPRFVHFMRGGNSGK